MPKTAHKDILKWHIEFREWMHTYPELFETRLHKDCFLRLALLTLESHRLDSLKPLYRGLPYAENSIRAYLRSLANAGWIRFEAPSTGDRRKVSLRIEPPFRKAVQDYLQHFGRLRNAQGDVESAMAAGTEPPPALDFPPGELLRVRA